MFERITGPAIIGCIAIIGAVSFWKTDWKTPLSKPFVDGVTQAALEDAFDDGLSIRTTSIQTWNAFRYAVFGETLDGAVSGKDGWLFTDEEYETGDSYTTETHANLMRIVDGVHHLEKNGTTVVIALLPDKSRIMDDKLKIERPTEVVGRYDLALETLSAQGVSIDDLRVPLSEGKKSGDVFMRTDTHWTPYGAKIVAQALAHQIQSATPDRSSFITEITGTNMNEGDLVTFADAGPFASRLNLGPEEYEVYVTSQKTEPDAGLGLFDDVTIPATLVGTSYSAIENWNFVGFLKEASKTDILSVAEQGRGPFSPMDDYLKQLAEGTPMPQVVVWEIPERYLTVKP